MKCLIVSSGSSSGTTKPQSSSLCERQLLCAQVSNFPQSVMDQSGFGGFHKNSHLSDCVVKCEVWWSDGCGMVDPVKRTLNASVDISDIIET